MSSTVVTIEEGLNMKNQNKTKVGVGSVVNTKIGELEKITREGGSISMRKYVMVCVQQA